LPSPTLPIPTLRTSVSYTAGVPLHRQLTAVTAAQQRKEVDAGIRSGGEWRVPLTDTERRKVRQNIQGAFKRQTTSYEEVLELAVALQEEALHAWAPSRLDYIKNAVQFDRRLVEAKKNTGERAALTTSAAAAEMGSGMGKNEEEGRGKGKRSRSRKIKIATASIKKQEKGDEGDAMKRKVEAPKDISVEGAEKTEAETGVGKNKFRRASRRSIKDAQEEGAEKKGANYFVPTKAVEEKTNEFAAAAAAAASTIGSHRKRIRK